MDAAIEAEHAIAWYEGERPGLGGDFEAAVDAALDLLAQDPIPSVPVQGAAAKRGIRRLILRRFPYDVVFVVQPDFVWVLAFAHHSRRPAYWRNRLRT
jgi:toxin ParE1/3/4